MKLLFTCFLSLIFSICYSQKKGICITVDDLPAVIYGKQGYPLKKEVTQKLINTFIKYKIPAIGYVNEGKVYQNNQVNPKLVALLEMWLKNGLDLGNHTYSHLSYHHTTFEEYTKDILKGELITKELCKKYNKKLHFFRHPYLRSGLNQAHTDSLKNFLTDHGYTEAPVTIDNDEYLFARAYHLAYNKNDQALMKQVGAAYIQYMEEKLVYFEQSAQALFNRDIQQILLIHANLLNADYFDQLAEVYLKHDYTFVSQEEALKDPAYQEEISKFSKRGISWLDRWALSRGKSDDFFKDDPQTPKFILHIK